MVQVKVLMSIVAICAVLCTLLLMWNESKVTCGVTTAKVFETMFLFVAVIATKEAARIK